MRRPALNAGPCVPINQSWAGPQQPPAFVRECLEFRLVLQTIHRFSQSRRRPLLKAPTSASTFKTLLKLMLKTDWKIARHK